MTKEPGGLATPSFDPDALKARYLAERDKRLRPDGTAQYAEVTGNLAHYLRDPYAEASLDRPPLTDEVDVLMIGGGFGGLLAAVRLREAGVGSVRIVEKGSDFGGTWYWNRYPGAACDIESYVYVPLLEETGYVPSEKYARGPEILEHARRIGRRYGLYDLACFQTEVTELRWDESIARWIVYTNRGDAIRARFVGMSTGPLHKPKLPGIPGIETFEGHAFHTSRWDYAYTGGDPDGGLTGLQDKRVGIIGTGATGVQVIPHLAAWSKTLHVFQRTPAVVDVRGNRPTDPAWEASLTAGWQQRRMDNFNTLVSGGTEPVDLVNDGWTEILHRIGVEIAGREDDRRQLADFEKMEQIRARVDALVEDKATAEALKPYFNIMCKRPCFHDSYLQTFNRPNVTLVDTEGRGVERITPRGVVANGQEYELDCLIYATGFEFQTEFTRRAGYQVYGRGGQTLTDKWKDGVSSLHGYFTRGFPNCFFLGNAQSANTPNFTHMLSEGGKHVAHVIRAALDRQARTIEPSAAAEAAWVEHILSFAHLRRKYDEECTPGYYNNEGMPSDLAVRNNFYAAGSLVFLPLLAAWRADGRFEGLEFDDAASAHPAAAEGRA